MELLTIIVNYRTPDLTLDCLRSLSPEIVDRPGFHVVVLDAASEDDSVPRLAEGLRHLPFRDRCTLVPLERNGGFAYANNVAIRRSIERTEIPRYYFLLNPDTIVRPGAIEALVRFADAHPQAGIVGSRCENLDGSPRSSAFRFHTVLGELESTAQIGLLSRLLGRALPVIPSDASPIRVDWVSGAAMLVRSEVVLTIGGLDEEFFLYYEETDFARRAADAGIECWHVPESRVVHLCGRSTGVTGTQSRGRRRPRYWFESRHRYFTKHHGRPYAAMADAAWLLGTSVQSAARALRRRPSDGPTHLGRDFLRFTLERWSRDA